jgi:predicted Fe-Mo cluster-binding NifX family protein
VSETLKKHRVAFASTDRLTVHKHFGQAEVFQIVDFDEDGYIFIEERSAQAACSVDGHDTNRFDAAIELLSDCEAVLVGKIGPGAADYLRMRGMRVFETPGVIENITKALRERKLLDR